MTVNSEQKVIGLHGSYFGHNFGDILLMRLFLGYVRGLAPDVRVVLPLANHQRQIEIGADGIGLEKMSEAVGVLFAGGGYLGEKPNRKLYWSIRNYRRHVVLGRRLRRRNIPYAIIGVGFGPLSNPLIRRAMVGLCNGARFLLFRDSESADFAIAYGVNPTKVLVGADAAITVSDCLEKFHGGGATVTQAQRVGIHLADPGGKEDIAGEIAEGVAKFCTRENPPQLVFMSDEMGKNAYPSQYTESVRRLQGMMGVDVEMRPYEGVPQLLGTIASCSLILTNKLHVGIVSASLRKQIVSIPFHTKTIRFYRQVDREQDCLHGQTITAHLVCNALEQRMGMKHVDIPTHVRELADKNRVITSEFLKTL